MGIVKELRRRQAALVEIAGERRLDAWCWSETALSGQELMVASAIFRITEPITICRRLFHDPENQLRFVWAQICILTVFKSGDLRTCASKQIFWEALLRYCLNSR